MATESAIRSAFDLKVTFVTATTQKIKINDLTSWTGLGMTLPPDVVKINFKLVSPSGVVLYENTNFTTPDMNIGTGDTLLDSLTFPNDGSGDPLQGTYTVFATIQYTPDGGSAITFVIEELHTYSESSLPEIAITQTVDCINSKLTSVDVTNYPGSYTIDSRVHKIYYPIPLGLTAITTSLASYALTPIYTGTFTTTITSTITVSLGGGSYAQWAITGSKEVLVECDQSLCDIYCCLSTLWRNYIAVKGRNTVLADEAMRKIRELAFLVQLYRSALDCGKNDKASEYQTEILAIAGCEPGCGCEDGAPQLIVPLGGGAANGTVVVDAGEGVDVDVDVDGDVTTYTVSIAQSIIDFMESNFILSIVTDTPDQIEVNNSDPQNLKINWIGDVVSLMSFRLILDISSPAAVSASFDLEEVYGPRFEFNPPTWATVYTFANTTEVANGPAAYKLTNFVKAGQVAKLDKVFAQLQKVEKNTSNDDDLVWSQRVGMEIIKIENEEIWFKLVFGGATYTHQQLISLDIDKIYIHFLIAEGTP